MTTPRITAGAFRYETTDALFNGDVRAEGVDLELRTGPTLPDIFSRLIVDEELDVAELGLTFYLRLLDSGDDRFVALPLFPNRLFRHSAVFVNAHAGIETPADLVGRTIGEFGIYGQDPGVWIKGILMDEHGFDPAANRWVIGGLDAPAAPFGFVPQTRPDGVEIRDARDDEALGPMLDRGELDVLFSANVPQVALDGSPNVRRLFADHEHLERDWFARTGIFPINHTVVVRRDVLEAEPDAVRAVAAAFTAAKEHAADRYRAMRRIYEVHSMLPWANALEERNRAAFGDDWWPYGVEPNRRALEAFTRYAHEQGIVSRRFSVDELFAAV